LRDCSKGLRPVFKMNITVIGGGLIGASWTALFLAHGHRVCVHDVAPSAPQRVRAELARIAPFLAELGWPFDPDSAQLGFESDLTLAMRAADIIQECGPERLAFKRQLWAQVEQHCPPHALLLSSSSGLTASMQASAMRTPQRMLVGHPFNPPHLVPLVEVVPGRKTSADATQRARAFYDSLGKQVVVLKKEIPGFVANRIQAAVLRESMALVRQGVVSVDELDAAVKHSLGLRWATGGPLLSAHLGGGAGGIRAYLQQFAGGLQLLWLHMRLKPMFLTSGARQALAQAIEAAHGQHSIDELASRRDHQQIAILQALEQTSKGK
jgi:ketoreductase RED1